MSNDVFDKPDDYVSLEEEVRANQENNVEENGSTEEDVVVEPFTPDQKDVNFTLSRPCSEEAIPEEESIIAFLQENASTVLYLFDKYNAMLTSMNDGKFVSKKKDATWLAALTAAIQNSNIDDTPAVATEREGSHWTQGITSGDDNNTLVRIGKPRQKLESGRRYSKEELVTYLARKSGTGTPFETFLPDCGYWVRLRSPTLVEVVAVQEQMQQTKLNVGMRTKGMGYSNADGIMRNAITELAGACIVASNKRFSTAADLFVEMSVFDEDILHHALAATMFAEGFNYSQACVADINTCSHVIQAKLNMAPLVWYDNNSFTVEQRRFIARRFTAATDEEFVAYRKGFGGEEAHIQWFGDIGVGIKPPSIEARMNACNIWLSTLIEMSQGTFNEPPTGTNRARYIDKLMDATAAMQNAHWISGIYERSEEALTIEDQLVSDDPEVIQHYLSNVLSLPQYMEKFEKAIKNYINKNVKAIVALPSHNCPKCNTPQAKAFKERYPHLIPIDNQSTFFTLASRKAYHLE